MNMKPEKNSFCSKYEIQLECFIYFLHYYCYLTDGICNEKSDVFFSDRPLLWLRWFPPSPYREYLTWSNDKHRINSRRDGHVHFEWAILFLWKDYSSVKCTVPILSCVLFFIQLLRACLHVFISIIKPGVNKKDMLGASKYTEALLYTFTTCIARLSR